MTDLTQLRSEVLQARAQAEGGDALALASASGLTALYNRLAPPVLRISDASERTLTVSATGHAFSGMDASAVIAHFSRAVASIALELSHPKDSARTLGRSDYMRAPLFASSSPGGPIRFSAQSGDLALGGDPVDSLAERALARLVNLLPEQPDDPTLGNRVASARVPSARALSEVSLAAKRMSGLTMSLVGGGERVDAVIVPEQADLIRDLLRDTREEVIPQSLTGRLDGMRYKRREFFLELSSYSDISGTIDEALVPVVESLLNQRVTAQVERVVRRDAAGRQHRAAYRLVGLVLAEPLDLQIP